MTRTKRPSLVIYTQGFVNLPGLLALRTRRYSIILSVVAFALVGANASTMTQEKVIWFLAVIVALFAIFCAICVTILDSIAWGYEKLRDELRGDQTSVKIEE